MTRTPLTAISACSLLLVGAGAQTAPVVQDTPRAVIVTAPSYRLTIPRQAGGFDYAVDPDANGRYTSVMRPGGEGGWFGYNAAAENAETRGASPEVTVRKIGQAVVVDCRALLSPRSGITHRAQYVCTDLCVVVGSRYDGPPTAPPLALVRVGPKLDVDIDALPQYLFFGPDGKRHQGTLPGQPREFYCGAASWGGPDRVTDFQPERPWQMLMDPETGAKLAVVYPFGETVWPRHSRFLQLYTDGGNYWYTGTGSAGMLGRDFVVCLYADAARDESGLDANLPRVLASVDEALASGALEAPMTALPPAPPGPLFLVNYDHAVGYPNIQAEARISTAALDTDPGLRVGLQAEGWTWDWLAQHDPAFVAEAREWLTRYGGRWVPGGGSYGQPYFTFISEESGFRQMLYGTRAIKQHLGYDNSIYVYSEHETMPQLPQILAGIGYRGAFFRTHMGYGGDGPSRDADWVLWTGPDGSAIPAVPAYTGREHGLGNEFILINYKPGIFWHSGPANNWADMDDFKREMQRRGVRNPIISRCEDWYTRPSPELLQDARDHSAEGARWATAEEVFDALETSGIEPQPFAAGANDFAPRQPWGYTGNRTWTGPRVASSKALTAEALASAAILSGWDWTPAHQARLDEAWKNLLIAEHHDSLICAIYNEGRDFTVPSERLSAELAAEAAAYLGSQVAVTGPAVLVFNPTGQPRTEPVRLTDTTGVGGLLDPEGQPAPLQVTDDGLWFVARNVPALGYCAYRVVPGAVPAPMFAAGSSANTGRYEVEVAPGGGLARLHDLQTGQDVLKPGTGILRGVVGSADERSQGEARITAAGPVIWRVEETGKVGAINYTLTYTLAAGSPTIGLHIRLDIPPGTRIACPDDRGTPDSRRSEGRFFDHGAKLRLLLDTGLPGDLTAVRHQPLTIAPMARGAEIVDANLWAGLEAPGAGLAVANRGSMGYRVQGSSLELLLAYSGEYVWGDNILQGTYDYDFALAPYGGEADRVSAHRQALEFDRPLAVSRFEGAGGRLPPRRGFLDSAPLPPAVAALSLFPQDGKLFLRLVDMSDAPQTVSLPGTSGLADLALRHTADLPGRFELHPWRAQTFEVAR